MTNVKDAETRLIESIVSDSLTGLGAKIIRALRRKGWRKPIRKPVARRYLAALRIVGPE